MALRKKERLTGGGPAFVIPPDLLDRFQGQIPFTLTGDQVGVIKDIMSDMTRDAPMNRLVQGDVGCGKTVVAAAAVAAAVLNRCQAALMAPTQILARQHYEFFSNLSTELGIRPVLLTGVLEKKERLDLYQKISEGECNLVIGTQALIQEGLSFHKLGLVVIDEQHRFGVRQRALLRSKGTTPHTLVMTATPIPRSLALILYGDTDISTIREYPGGRRAVHTYVVKDEKRQRGYEGLVKRLAQGEQGLVICPAIEATETRDMENAKDMFHKLKGIVPPKFRIALIHGRLAPAEKNDIMSRFRRGDMDLLVSTTVVEVGVHAPGATVLLIEHPERFGLSQLHQLRGRVGRGSQKGLCLLMLPEKVSEEAFERLKVMTETSDGFEIAQKDLEMRGQGELMGFRQAGAGEIDLMEIMEEPELLMEAKRAAEEIIENDPELNSYDQLLLIKNKE
jgi:ATP-dependent DNA helicase RecG